MFAEMDEEEWSAEEDTEAKALVDALEAILVQPLDERREILQHAAVQMTTKRRMYEQSLARSSQLDDELNAATVELLNHVKEVERYIQALIQIAE